MVLHEQPVANFDDIGKAGEKAAKASQKLLESLGFITAGDFARESAVLTQALADIEADLVARRLARDADRNRDRVADELLIRGHSDCTRVFEPRLAE